MDKKVIDCFENEHGFLSNYYNQNFGIFYGNAMFYSVEAGFQAAKYTGKHFDDVYRIFSMLQPDQAKHLGRAIQLRKDWEEVKDTVMRELLYQKFNNPAMKVMLLDTGDAELVEGNWWHDNYWGSCTCSKCGNRGQNKLGKLLMEIRDNLKKLDGIQMEEY